MTNEESSAASSRKSRTKRNILDYLQSGSKLGKAAKLAGVSVVAVENWRKEDPNFDADVRAAGQLRSYVAPE